MASQTSSPTQTCGNATTWVDRVSEVKKGQMSPYLFHVSRRDALVVRIITRICQEEDESQTEDDPKLDAVLQRGYPHLTEGMRRRP